jgi:two-component system, chemotaxis family, CheB/CheR fusion protein
LLQSAALGARPLRVLVVDDNRDTVLTLGILFRSEGIDVRMVQRARDVLPTAHLFQPDVVLLDIGMPDQSGYDVAEDLRKEFGRRLPAIVAVTGYKGLADKCQARASGFDHYVEKPYDPMALLDLVTSFRAAATQGGRPDLHGPPLR